MISIIQKTVHHYKIFNGDFNKFQQEQLQEQIVADT
jgi:hypothetical protein